MTSFLKIAYHANGRWSSRNQGEDMEQKGKSFVIIEPKYEELKMTKFGYGRIYAIELGGYVKIGSTRKPRDRFYEYRSFRKRFGVPIGKIAISQFVINYRELEKMLHERLSEFRTTDAVLGNEIFQIDIETAAREIVKVSDCAKFEKTEDDEKNFEALIKLLGYGE